jgi:hypothetical protein
MTLGRKLIAAVALLSAAAIAANVSITTTSLANATVGQQYNQSIATSGGKRPFRWSIVSGALPGGLSIDPGGGTISGIPTNFGVFNFTVRVVDKDDDSDTQALTITVNPPPLAITTTALAPGIVGTPYSQNLGAAGGSGGYTWTNSGALPGGLSLNSSGTISGTPNTPGSTTFTAIVTDSGGRTASKPLTIVISPAPVSILTSTLSAGTVGVTYTQTLTAGGGSGGYVWTLSGGSLPGGLSLSQSGVITGTPTGFGLSNFTVTATDSGGRSTSKALAINIDPAPLTVATSSLAPGTVGVAYSQTLTASGGTGGNTWKITAGALPAGLTLGSGGDITGTPTASGTANFTATVTDGAGHTAPKALSIAIDPAALTVTTNGLPPGTVGVAYSQTLAASGGTGGNTWTVTAGALPAGLTLGSGGDITGNPTAAGTANFTATVTDSGGHTAPKALSITINPATLTVTTTTLPAGTVGTPYSQTLTASGGTGGNTWTITAGALPAGLTLGSGGDITGTPTTAGTANFTATVTDNGGHTAPKALSITINSATLTVTTNALPPGVVGTAYSQTLAATGGTGGNSWTLTGGALPAGLTLGSGGDITGTPTAAGTANFTATVTDNAGHTAPKALSIRIDPATLNVTTTALPPGTLGAPYSQTLTATGGTGGNTWTVTAGALPAGLTLGSGGDITGTPTGAGTANFTATVTDNGGHTAQKALSITINSATLTVATPSLSNGAVGAPYSQTLNSTGGAGGNTWSITSGALPKGLTLAGNGTISGTPTTPETATFTVQVKDSAAAVATKPLSITIVPAPLVITTQSLPAVAKGAAYSQTLVATGGSGGYRWTVSAGNLPTGLTLDASGRISGNADGASSSFTAQVTDNAGTVATKTYTIVVATTPTFSGSTTLASGVVATPYSLVVAVVGGQTPYTFSVISGQLPPGLTLNGTTGEIGGRPTQPGTFTFTVQVRDAAGVQAQSAFSLTIANGVTITSPPILPNGSISVAYQVDLQAAGGAPPYTWSATAGSLPAGLNFGGDGKIAGTPTAAGTFNFTATVSDANGVRATKDFTLTVAAGLTITTAPQLSPGVPSAAYSESLVAIGGTPPYIWSISAGALPPGVRLDPATGALAGTPSASGSYDFTATVTDSANVTAQKAFTIVIAPGLTFTTPAALPNAVAGTPYAFTLQASGGQTPYSWRISDGALPDGLFLNSSTGVISGTPATPGTFNFTVEVVDPGGMKASRTHTIVTDLPGTPALVITGVSPTLGPLQQPSIDLALSVPYPVAITGRLNLGFTPANGLTDDPAVQFSAGGRSVPFTIAANDTHATFGGSGLALQTGSVAGTIQLTVDTLNAGSVTLPAPGAPVQSAQISPAAAIIRSVAVNRTSGGFEVQIVGVSTTREVTSATVRFRPSGSEVTLPLTDAARAWFQSAGSTPYGGQFTLTLPFSFVGGSVAVDSVGVVLTNSMGASQEVAAQY